MNVQLYFYIKLLYKLNLKLWFSAVAAMQSQTVAKERFGCSKIVYNEVC